MIVTKIYKIQKCLKLVVSIYLLIFKESF